MSQQSNKKSVLVSYFIKDFVEGRVELHSRFRLDNFNAISYCGHAEKSKPGGNIVRKLVLIATVIAISAPAMAWAAAQETETAIQKAKEQYMAAFNKGDAAGVAQQYTDTAYLMPPGSPTITGRAAIQSYWDAGIKAGVKNLALTPGKIDQFGEIAREIGNYSFETKDGTKQEGKWVGIWKPQYGSWKLDTDVWNTDK